MAIDTTKSEEVSANYKKIMPTILSTLQSEQARSLTGNLRARVVSEMIRSSLQTAYQIAMNADLLDKKNALLDAQILHEEKKSIFTETQTAQLNQSVIDNKVIKAGDQLYGFISEMVGNDFTPSSDLLNYAFRLTASLTNDPAPVADSGTITKV